ncbi:MAG: ComEC/Rec2 family competence protein [Rhizomicrobium sp.]
MGIAPSAPLSIGLREDCAREGTRPRGVSQFIDGALAEERGRGALWLPVLFGGGIGVYFGLPFEPARLLVVAVGCGAFLLLTASFFSRPVLRACCIALAMLLAGFCLAKLRTERMAAPVVMHRIGPVELVGRVESAQLHGRGIRAVLAPIVIGGLDAKNMPRRVRVSVRHGGRLLSPGATVRLAAVLMPPPPPAEPGDYDFGRAAFFLRIGAVGYAFGSPVPVGAAPPPDVRGRIALALQGLRFRMSARIHAVLPGSTGAIAAALITGDRGGISEADDQALRDAGLAHVLAIAGLHMALVGFGLFWTVRALLALWPAVALTQPIKKWAALAALCGAGFYLAISGAATPALRAFTMLAMMLLAILFDRPALSMRSLAFAATVLLIAAPESLIQPGFQMSFAAVASLIAVAEWEQRRMIARGGFSGLPFPTLRRYLRGIAVTSFVGSLATLPYAAFHFDRATHYAVLGNLLAMPIMGFVTMPMAALAVLLMPLGLDFIPLQGMGLGIRAMLAVGRFVSHLPGAVTTVAAWPVSALVLISLGGLWIVIWRSRWRWLGLAPALAGLALVLLARPPDLLIARDGQTIAIRSEDGKLHFVRRIADEYSASEWLKRDGDARAARDAVAIAKDGVRCDALGCIARVRGTTIAAVSRADALREDCADADIVIGDLPMHGVCRGPKLVIGKFDVIRNGAYAVWLGDAPVVETVQQTRGNRPWSRAPWQRKGRRSDRESGDTAGPDVSSAIMSWPANAGHPLRIVRALAVGRALPLHLRAVSPGRPAPGGPRQTWEMSRNRGRWHN